MRKAVRWFVKQVVESVVVTALLAAVLLPAAVMGGCSEKKIPYDAGNGWTAIDQTPIGEQIWKKRFEAEKMTVYAYGHYTITVVKDAP